MPFDTAEPHRIAPEAPSGSTKIDSDIKEGIGLTNDDLEKAQRKLLARNNGQQAFEIFKQPDARLSVANLVVTSLDFVPAINPLEVNLNIGEKIRDPQFTIDGSTSELAQQWLIGFGRGVKHAGNTDLAAEFAKLTQELRNKTKANPNYIPAVEPAFTPEPPKPIGPLPPVQPPKI